MSYPILYSATETKFDHNGFGILSDCVSCEVSEEANGAFELSMRYPMDGIHFEDIVDRSIIKAKADQFREPQLFRVYSVGKPMSGIVTILAAHISYDLSGIPVSPFSAESASMALYGMKENAVIDCPFEFWTDKSTSASFSVKTPSSIRSRLGGVSGSVLDVYGGEYEFDNYVVKLHNNRGENRGVSIRYGKNLTDIKQEENCSSVATGVYPYWFNEETGELVQLPEKIVNAPGEYNFVKIRPLDLSQHFVTKPTEEQVRSFAQRYVSTNDIGVPKVSLSVSFAQLEQSEEYKHLKLSERVGLFDTVNVEFPDLKVSSNAKVIKLVYDVLADKAKSASLGSVRANIANTIVQQQQQIEQAPTKSDLEKAQEAATAWLTNGKGYKVERRDDLGRVIDTLYMDAPDIEEAVNVLRIGQSGIGFSSNGVNGPYKSAWTLDGKFNADFIVAGSISASLIKGGAIIAEGMSYLPPTREDVTLMLWSSLFPDNYPPKDFYDLNGDGVFSDRDVLLADDIYMGKADISECPSAFKTNVKVIIEASNPVSPIVITGKNMWGSDVSVYFGANGSQIPLIKGDCSVGGKFSVGEYATIQTLSLNMEDKPKTLSWKDNGDGTYALVGTPEN